MRPTPEPARFAGIQCAAIRALYQELVAWPKPGLVSLTDCGSHTDMDAPLLFRSLFTLRGYFSAIARLGAAGAAFADLAACGMAAEQRMLAVTNGINTHRGAIFNLGLIAAAAGLLQATGQSWRPQTLAECIAGRWGTDILMRPASGHNGARMCITYGVGGARQEAAAGFPHVLGTGFPALQYARAAGTGPAATIQCLFALMAVLDDTNLLHRGGREGLRFAQQQARTFLEAGGVCATGWQEAATAIHRRFMERRLSPGGSADLLAVCLMMDLLMHSTDERDCR